MQWGIKVVTHAAKLIEYKYLIRLIHSQSNEFIEEGDRVQLQGIDIVLKIEKKLKNVLKSGSIYILRS